MPRWCRKSWRSQTIPVRPKILWPMQEKSAVRTSQKEVTRTCHSWRREVGVLLRSCPDTAMKVLDAGVKKPLAASVCVILDGRNKVVGQRVAVISGNGVLFVQLNAATGRERRIGRWYSGRQVNAV